MERAYPRKIALRDGKTIQIRPLQKSDETRLIEFFGKLPASETQFQNKDVHDPQVVRGFSTGLDLVRVWCLLAFSETQQIVGNATLHMAHLGWQRQLGEIRVVVAPEFQQLGLATLLIHELVNQASVKQLRKIETKILGSQLGVKRTFERLGFQEEARLEGHALDLENQPHDLIIMTVTIGGLLDNLEEAMWEDFGDLMTEQDGGFLRGS
jgi:ribosomal protein S18 acetylase RimI-like enzyme